MLNPVPREQGLLNDEATPFRRYPGDLSQPSCRTIVSRDAERLGADQALSPLFRSHAERVFDPARKRVVHERGVVGRWPSRRVADPSGERLALLGTVEGALGSGS